MSWTGSLLASQVDALYHVDCYVRVREKLATVILVITAPEKINYGLRWHII